MKIIVSMIARNEANRHLSRALTSALQIAHFTSGVVAYTDDASTDDSLRIAMHAGAQVQTTSEPAFWSHEGAARNRAYKFAASFAEPGDWILSLDADETISSPELLAETVDLAVRTGHPVIGLPLYEFWTPDEYRVDGYWFGSNATRLFEYRPDAEIAMKEMACGSEPTWVSHAPIMLQQKVHLLHWGYVNPEDRPRKHHAYTTRAGGHGHSSSHVNSIITEPTLRRYEF